MKKIIILLYILFPSFLFAQKKMTQQEYINKYSDIAMKEMKRVGIPASITLAQGILESGNGNSRLATKGNNHFGIKCHNDWKGKKMYHDDDKKGECFRVYKNDYQSFIDHSEFLKTKSRYAFLFDLKPDDYKGWAKGLKKAGYATNPKYPKRLIDLIEVNKLYKYDEMVLKGNYKKRKKVIASTENTTSDNSEEQFADNLPAPDILADIDNFDISAPGREVKQNNGRNYIIVKQGDTFYSLAKEFDLMVWQLYSFNDYDKDEVLKAGSVLYLQLKRNRPERKYSSHRVKQGETLQFISQVYGMRAKKIAKINAIGLNDDLKAGKVLRLKQ